MSNAINVSFGTCILLSVIISMMAGHFLRHLEKTDPTRFAEIWAEAGAVLNFFYPIRISLLYVVPRTYELWQLDERGKASARRLRVVTIAFLVLVALTVGAILLQVA
jgi:hypothetical protein